MASCECLPPRRAEPAGGWWRPQGLYEKYYAAFKQQEVGFDTLLQCSDEDLKDEEMGLPKGPRVKILRSRLPWAEARRERLLVAQPESGVGVILAQHVSGA